MKGKDKIPGGLTDKLTIADVAKKHKMTVEEIQKELDAGIKVEMEHTDSKEKAEEIALDHLLELSDYYKRLDKMEKDAEKEGVNENITAYARRMRELAGLADGNQHKTLKTVQEGESSFEGGATFYAKDMMGESLKKEALDSPDKADLDNDGKISDYEEKRGKAIDSATKDKSVNESEEEFETHKFEQRAIEEGADDKELYSLNENTIIVLDFLDEDGEK